MSTFVRIPKPWSQEESNRLIHLFRQKRTAQEMAADLNRTVPSIHGKCIGLGLKRNVLWSDKDIAFLRAHYPTNMPMAKIAKRLKRKPPQIHHKASELGIKRGKGLRWSAKDFATLTEMCARDVSPKVIAKRLGRTENAVRSMSLKFGLRKPQPKRRPWTNAEDKRFAKLWQAGVAVEDICSALQRSRGAVIKRRARLKLSPRLLQEEVAEDVWRLYRAGYPLPEIAKRTGIAQSLLEQKLKGQRAELDLLKPSQLTEDEINTAITYYKNGCTIQCIAARLRRSPRDIYCAVKECGPLPPPQDKAHPHTGDFTDKNPSPEYLSDRTSRVMHH